MIFWLIPITSIAVSPMLNDATTLLRSGLIAIIPLISILLKPLEIRKYKFVLVTLIIIQCSFIISWQINKQEDYIFLFGAYGRNSGFLSLTGLFIIIFLFANQIKSNEEKFVKTLYITICLGQLYGLIQYLNLDPLDWAEDSFNVPLTLGNPNFSSAFLGMTSLVPLYYFKKNHKKIKYLHLSAYLVSGFLILQTNSSQGFVLYVFSTIIFALTESRRLLRKYIKIILLSLASSLGILIIFISTSLLSLNRFANSILNDLNMPDRLNHWEVSWRMFLDNLWLGTGLGDQQKYSASYLTLDEAKKWGSYLQPDKAHSVPLDYFVTGGIFAGLSYLFFIILIFYYLYKLSKESYSMGELQEITVIGICWAAYILQTLFSPSHIFLDLLGFALAGSILGLYFNSKEILSRNSK
jgi:O-antigen ligase